MPLHKNCDGFTRRDALKLGVLGATGFSLAGYLRSVAAGETASTTAKARSAIFVNLAGGPSHMDTFDLKPNSPSEYRGEFNPVSTNVAGIQISEHLPKLATCTDAYTILRGVTHTLAAHPLGQEYVNTGSRPLPSLEYPGYGAVVARELPGVETLPPFVAIPSTSQKPGFLGVKYAPLSTGTVPKPGQPFRVRGISLGDEVTPDMMRQRSELLADLDTAFHGYEENSQLLEGLDQFSQQAHAMITSRRAKEAFDVSRESPAFAAPFGISPFGQSCLLATRLVEAGVRFVTVTYGGWDTHFDNWNRLKTRLLPSLDDGLAALFQGLQLKGLLDETVVYVTGEFGRTPKINTMRNGRDHYPRNMFMLMAGGGIRGGRVLGESDDKGTAPLTDGYSPADVAASFYRTLGIDHTKEYHTNTGRPITIVRDGHVIDELFG
jgi:hypothetical protein